MSNVSQVSHARKIVIGVWRVCIALCLIVVTSPIFWMIDYEALRLFVKRYGIDVVAVLSVLLDVWLGFNTHPVRGSMIVVFCLLMSILQHPEDYFE